MAEIKKISTELQLLDKFLDTSGSAGSSGSVLTSTTTGTSWVSAGTPGSGIYLPLSAGGSFPLTGALNINLGSTNVATIKLRRDTTGDNQIVGDIEFDTTAAQGGDDRIALIRATTSGGDGTGRGGAMLLYTRQSGSANFNTTTYNKFGAWFFPSNVTTGGQITVPSGYSVNIGTSRIHSTSTSYLLGGNVGIGTTSNSAEETNNGVPKFQVTTATAVLGEFPLAARFTTASDAGNNSGVSVLINSGNDRGLMISAGRQTGNTAKVTFNVVENNGTELTGISMLQAPESGSAVNVGIGTTAPSFKLHVDSDVASGDVCFIHHDNASQSSGTVMKIRSDAGDNAGSALLNIENNTGNALYVRGDRNVGIGTNDPLSKLVVRTSTDHNFEVEETGGELRLSALNNARSANIGLQFAASEFNFLSGNVGIGTTRCWT